MSTFVVSLPMYDWPEERASVDADWAALRSRLLQAGMDVPAKLARRNADLPPVPGGICDGEGRVVAPDPAMLPPEELDMQALWRHPQLLLAQTCWGPMEVGLAEHVEVVGQPSYEGMEGGQGPSYSSAILMRSEQERGRGVPDGVAAPENGRPLMPVERMRGARLAYNGPDSMSGIIALRRDLEALGESLAIFKERSETGSHRASIAAVAEGRADICAVDCRTWQLARRYELKAAAIRVFGWTGLRKGLPLITSRHRPPAVIERLRAVLARP